MPADQITLAQNGQNGHQPATPMFQTDEDLARDLQVAIRQLGQIENGLTNLIAAVPSLARMLSTVIGILAAVAAQLERSTNA